MAEQERIKQVSIKRPKTATAAISVPADNREVAAAQQSMDEYHEKIDEMLLPYALGPRAQILPSESERPVLGNQEFVGGSAQLDGE